MDHDVDEGFADAITFPADPRLVLDVPAAGFEAGIGLVLLRFEFCVFVISALASFDEASSALINLEISARCASSAGICDWAISRRRRISASVPLI